MDEMTAHKSGDPLTLKGCVYTVSPDEDFIIDRHPAHTKAIVVSACSGHGFKFAPAIGEAVSDLVVEGATRHDLTPTPQTLLISTT